MEAPAKGAKEAGGRAIGFTMLDKPGNEFLTQRIDSSIIGRVEESVEVQYGARLGLLLSSDAFIIAAGGGPGSMTEFFAIANLNAKIWRPKKFVAILRLPNSVYGMNGWDKEMLDAFEINGMLPGNVREIIKIKNNPADAVDWVVD